MDPPAAVDYPLSCVSNGCFLDFGNYRLKFTRPFAIAQIAFKARRAPGWMGWFPPRNDIGENFWCQIGRYCEYRAFQVPAGKRGRQTMQQFVACRFVLGPGNYRPRGKPSR